MTRPITTLFSDVGGVLLTNGWDRRSRRLAAETFDLDPDEMDERHHLTFDAYEEGKLSLDDYLDRTVFHAPRPFDRKAFTDFMYAQSRPLPAMLEYVRGLKAAQGIKIVAVNNEGRELNVYRIRTFGLGCFMDAFVSSCFVHFRKPDADIFRIALDIAQAAPEESAYIDDRALFVEVAATLGIRGVVHRSAEATAKELAAMGGFAPFCSPSPAWAGPVPGAKGLSSPG
ncbi:Haloacid dehalogenase domain protein hydrolase [Solidesulfovibrio carbinoliphilus subsp. oakridgensis]|uniref:Haloacid dehalogenase domain protein hydrolase n=1 Tax=Solidesulfovibrio carbinoliphilus subsp. oakridgensis TaxID=694327 RepID=G7Q886_9BACT|nr:HAD family phosphatase [Solidesulfovibrio carbinoliphilus]EHJ48100.1 Haloacid dehalogenase domain protein hydrolase [Solidesulfovibrio carbinoliphilus subsp. oakridgensis]